MPFMVAVAPILIEMPERVDEQALDRANEAMEAMLKAANGAHPDVEIVNGKDPRYDSALIQGVLAYVDSAYPESAERAAAAVQALGLLQGGEERMN
jgi:hypothetical protein